VIEPPLTWCRALEEEYRALYGVEPFDGTAPAGDPLDPLNNDDRLRALHHRIHERAPSALCLSGGGIRSATFALGVLQGLAQVGILDKLDYLSTVSGGGYIGGWFTAWLHREGPAGRGEVLEAIDPGRAQHQAHCGNESDEVSPVDRVRRTCRYLAPQGGVVSADVWTLVTTMSRNLVLNWLVILPILAAALMVPRLYYGGVQAVERGFVAPGQPCAVPGDAASWAFLIGIASFVICTVYAVLNLVGLGGRWSQGRFLCCFLLPAVAGSVAMTFFWSAYPCVPSLRDSVVLSSVIPAVGWVVIGAVAGWMRKRAGPNDGSTLKVNVGARTVLAALAAGPIIGAGAWWLGSFEYGFGPGEYLRELYAVFAVPMVLSLVLIQMTVFIGLASSELSDGVLEWWSRCGAWVGIAAVLWIVAGVLVFYMADVVELGIEAVGRALSMDRRAAAAGVAALVPLLSSLAGIAARSGGRTGQPSAIRAVAQKLALPAVIFVLLSTIAWGDLRAAEKLEYHRIAGSAMPCTPDQWRIWPCHADGAGIGENVILGGGLLAFGLIMSWFVPVNRFSLHGMYRERLVRTFLGASRRDRHPNGFTGFDAHDDLCVHHLDDVRPLHVINTTLNAVSSTHVGRHETQAQSFTFSPLHVGNHDLGYRHAPEFGSDGGGKATGVSLGMALAISGAAASPAMGMYSTKSRAFLLTLANARLGLWFGNPQDGATWQSSEPPLGVGPVLRELFGLTTDHNPYVYLSDGGHYENLGLWEMVSRRCRFIIVSDAGADPMYTFDDLANAVRRIRLDLGVPIQFDPIEVTRQGQNDGNPHAAIGRIRYAVVDGAGVPDGVILYLKATLSGDEPVDVRNFASSDPLFPHDSTANQFFDEARFESYRMLGFHTVLSVASGLQQFANVEALCDTARTALAELELQRRAGTPVAT
jgi:Patatin-like phospholipase